MYKVDHMQVGGVVRETSLAISGKGFNPIEVTIGLAELIGRTIVAAGQNHIQMEEMAKIVNEHVMRTIQIGAHAQGKGPIARAS